MSIDLPKIPIHDYRVAGMLGYQRDAAERAERVMDTVLAGMGRTGKVGRLFLPVADRMADKRLTMMMDPYQTEIRAIRRWIGRAGPIAFNLSYEFGCTARAYDGKAPMLFRTLDWPFEGIGEMVEIVMLPGEAGDWITATWPGVVGCLQGAAPGRFAAVLNQAPERVKGGRARSWLTAKRRVLKGNGIAPAHLLRQVFETAPDYATAVDMLMRTPVAVPVIYTIAGQNAGEACTIERTETNWAVSAAPAAANHFVTELGHTTPWRPRGYDSPGRRDAILADDTPPNHDALAAPILNPLTRLAVTASAAGEITVTGYEGARQVTGVTSAEVHGGGMN